MCAPHCSEVTQNLRFIDGDLTSLFRIVLSFCLVHCPRVQTTTELFRVVMSEGLFGDVQLRGDCWPIFSVVIWAQFWLSRRTRLLRPDSPDCNACSSYHPLKALLIVEVPCPPPSWGQPYLHRYSDLSICLVNIRSWPFGEATMHHSLV